MFIMIGLSLFWRYGEKDKVKSLGSMIVSDAIAFILFSLGDPRYEIHLFAIIFINLAFLLIFKLAGLKENNRLRMFLEKHSLGISLLIFGIPLLGVPLYLIFFSGFLYTQIEGVLVVSVMFGGIYLLVAFAIVRTHNKSKLLKEDIAAKPGLNYRRGVSPSMEFYRNHDVEIFKAMGKGYTRYTAYRVIFYNPQKISMHLYRAGLRRKFWEKLGILQDITVNDPKFDQEFVIEGNLYLVKKLQAILDPSIRNKIMNTKKFHIHIEGNAAQYEEHRFISETERLRSILDLMIDIVERIEKAESIVL